MIKSRFFIALSVFLLFTLIVSEAYPNEFCSKKDGLVICVEPKGVIPLANLIPSETSSLFMNVFLLRIKNLSTYTISIKPDDFYCTTLYGKALVIDKPLYDKIEWPGKLEDYELLPLEEIERFIFFPASRDYVRAIIHRVPPIVEVRLY